MEWTVHRTILICGWLHSPPVNRISSISTLKSRPASLSSEYGFVLSCYYATSYGHMHTIDSCLGGSTNIVSKCNSINSFFTQTHTDIGYLKLQFTIWTTIRVFKVTAFNKLDVIFRCFYLIYFYSTVALLILVIVNCKFYCTAGRLLL